VVAHVLDAARENDVGRAHGDLARTGGDRRDRAGAHPIDREAGHGLGDAGEEGDVASERQALVADLRGSGEDDVADPLRRHLWVPAQQLARDLDRHVVGARAPEDALRARAPERCADAVDEEDLVQLPRHAATLTRAYSRACGRETGTRTASGACRRSRTPTRASGS
jgi:hypothetical protein